MPDPVGHSERLAKATGAGGATAASHIRFVGVGRCLSLPECAPKCAPKVHGAVRAAGYRWQASSITLAFTHEKTRIP